MIEDLSGEDITGNLYEQELSCKILRWINNVDIL